MNYLYEGKCLQKGNRVIRVLFYEGVPCDKKKSPSGWRRWRYRVELNGHIKHMDTHNVSRLVHIYHYTVREDEEPYECYLHAQHAVKHQENVTEKTEWLWNKFLKFFYLDK